MHHGHGVHQGPGVEPSAAVEATFRIRFVEIMHDARDLDALPVIEFVFEIGVDHGVGVAHEVLADQELLPAVCDQLQPVMDRLRGLAIALMVVYHFSSVDPEHQGCAAHGSDTQLAAAEGLKRLEGFREAIENSYCCGASIDLLLIGLDTDTDAIRALEKSGKKFEFPVKWGIDLQSEHERYLTERHIKKPVILYDYPASIKPFYMRVNDDQETVAAMDILVPSIGEIIGGSQREERLDVIEARMEAMGMEKETYWWYLESRQFGTVPHSGFGLGFERLLMLVTGISNIRDVIPFPRTPGSIDF